jgi:hypothetical protein
MGATHLVQAQICRTILYKDLLRRRIYELSSIFYRYSLPGAPRLSSPLRTRPRSSKKKGPPVKNMEEVYECRLFCYIIFFSVSRN